MDTLALPLMRPNTMVTSGAVRDALVRHPQIVKSYHGNNGEAGIVPDAFIAQLFGLRDFFFSRAIRNTAKPGQTLAVAQVWANNIAFLHQNPLANTKRGFTWGYTPQWQSRVSGQIAEPKTGLRGSVRVRVGESVNELVVGMDGSYLLTAAVT
jgi:hypothetical protein